MDPDATIRTNAEGTEAARHIIAEHAPGPWTWADDHPNGACVHVYAPGPFGPTEVATCFAVPFPAVVRNANARLMAAAPEMHAALQRAYDLLRRVRPPVNGIKEYDGTMMQLRAAIAKATAP